MEHDLELFSPILEILEIGVSATSSIILEILENAFFTQSYPGNSGSYDPYLSPILEIVDRRIHISVLSWK